jgi:outer membrane receptor protein involved in Fe transport
VDLRFFADLDQRKDITGPAPWLKGTRVSLGVANLFNERIRVRDAAGATPTGYQPANLDALGRTVRFSVRKLL